jgi:predicted DNA-binding protein
MTKLLTISLNKKYEYLLKELHKISNETGKPISRIIVEAIENYIRNLNPENISQETFECCAIYFTEKIFYKIYKKEPLTIEEEDLLHTLKHVNFEKIEEKQKGNEPLKLFEYYLLKNANIIKSI